MDSMDSFLELSPCHLLEVNWELRLGCKGAIDWHIGKMVNNEALKVEE